MKNRTARGWRPASRCCTKKKPDPSRTTRCIDDRDVPACTIGNVFYRTAMGGDARIPGRSLKRFIAWSKNECLDRLLPSRSDDGRPVSRRKRPRIHLPWANEGIFARSRRRFLVFVLSIPARHAQSVFGVCRASFIVRLGSNGRR